VERRYKYIMLPFPLLTQMVMQGWKSSEIQTIQGVPPGAKLIKTQYENYSGNGMMIFEHPSFPDIGSTGWPEKINLEFEIK